MKASVERDQEKQVPRCFAPQNDKAFSLCGARDHLWAAGSATMGAAVWAGMAVLARMGIARLGAIELIFLFAPLVIVPLGMELGGGMGAGGRLEEIARKAQPAAALLAVGAFCLAVGNAAAIAALPWMGVCTLMAGVGVMDLRPESWLRADKSVRPTLVRAALAIARIDLAVGGAWLVASRLGMRPMGIQEPIGLLTAVHFHFAGFATATIAAATLRFAAKSGGRWLKPVVVMVVGMPFVVAAGYVTSATLKMTAALLFSASAAGLAIFVRACGKRAQDGAARALLQTAAAAVFAGMVLSGTYAVGDLVGSDVLTIPQMARTHGILNAVGFCLTGLLGWLVEISGQEQKA